MQIPLQVVFKTEFDLSYINNIEQYEVLAGEYDDEEEISLFDDEAA